VRSHVRVNWNKLATARFVCNEKCEVERYRNFNIHDTRSGRKSSFLVRDYVRFHCINQSPYFTIIPEIYTNFVYVKLLHFILIEEP
jgi:hypothetical protein